MGERYTAQPAPSMLASTFGSVFGVFNLALAGPTHSRRPLPLECCYAVDWCIQKLQWLSDSSQGTELVAIVPGQQPQAAAELL